MILYLVAVKDNAVEAYQPAIHVVRAKGEALRNFTDAVNGRDAQLAKHAADFELWLLGQFDDNTGIITSKPERLARATDVKQD